MSMIIVLLLIIFAYSYLKFKRRYRVDVRFMLFMEQKCLMMSDRDVESLLSLCSAYTNALQYRKAYDKYQEILNDAYLKLMITPELKERIVMNMRFCDAPLLWSSGPKDHMMFRYLHHFFLVRFGRRRYNFISEKDVLEFNSFQRMLDNR